MNMANRRNGTHSLYRERLTHGEYHNLFTNLKQDPKKFYEFVRMSLGCFNYILQHVETSLNKNWCNLHSRPISPEEKLVITLRYFK